MSNTEPRWGDRPPAEDDEAALAALLNESNDRVEKKTQDQNKGRPTHTHQRPHEPRGDGRGGSRWDNNDRARGNNGRDDRYRPPHERDGRYGDKPIVEDDREQGSGHKRRRRWNDQDPEGPERWGEDAAVGNSAKPDEEGEKPEKVKADFGLSGALATDTKTGNVRNGVTLKFSEPAEARIPNTRWRLYVFRKKDAKTTDNKDDLIDTYHISKQSSYLFGREHAVADIPVDHPSLSKQHAVLQYRSLPTRSQEIGKPDKLLCKPYLMDLESTNGTFINGVRIDSARYYELRRGDVISLGASTREYVLLTEQSTKTGI